MTTNVKRSCKNPRIEMLRAYHVNSKASKYQYPIVFRFNIYTVAPVKAPITKTVELSELCELLIFFFSGHQIVERLSANGKLRR